MTLQEQDLDGIRIRIHEDADKTCAERIISALELIKQIDPRTYALIPRFLTGGIAVTEMIHTLGHYDPDKKACCLAIDFAKSREIPDIALLIVHELCHARLMQRGIGYDEPIRVRVEEICRRRELAFARLLEHQNNEYDYVQRVLERLNDLSAADYTDAIFTYMHRQNVLRKLRSLKALNAPILIRRWAVTRIRRKWRHDDGRSRQDDV